MGVGGLRGWGIEGLGVGGLGFGGWELEFGGEVGWGGVPCTGMHWGLRVWGRLQMG